MPLQAFVPVSSEPANDVISTLALQAEQRSMSWLIVKPSKRYPK